MPVQVLGESAPYQPQAEGNRNLLVGGISVTGVYDDNALGNGTSDIQAYLSPSIALQHTWPHMQGTLTYRPGYFYNRRASERNQFTQYFGGSFSYQFSPRLQIGLRQEYSVSTNPFEPISGNQFMNAQGGLSALDATAIVPEEKRTTILSGAEIAYRLSARSTVGATGMFNSLDYGPNDPTLLSEQLRGSQTTSGSAFYSHQFSARRTAGVQYEYTDLRQDMLTTHVRMHRLMLFHEFAFATRGSITLFAGPEYTQSDSIVELFKGPLFSITLPISGHGLTPAIGVTYNWRGRYTGLQLEYMRHVTEGSGLVTVAETNSGSAQLFRQITPRLTAQIGVAAVDNDSLNLTNYSSWLRTISATVRVQRQLRQHLYLDMGYARAWQSSTGTAAVLGNDNRVDISLRYEFERPLGR